MCEAFVVVQHDQKHPSPPQRAATRHRRPSGHWLLQDAKARFSELVTCVHSEGDRSMPRCMGGPKS